ncbi:MAG: HIT domain-containing protein [Chloroflexi bacterium]|nr:HIT domain-containing protein [Chloroflexota bacterium]
MQERRSASRDEKCVFCEIVADRIPAAKIREDATTLAFMNIAPFTEGHVLVIPKRHSRNLLDIGADDLRDVGLAAQDIARRQRERLGCAGISVFQSNEPAGWQSVFHYHLHVVPRYVGDPLTVPIRPQMREMAALELLAAKLR